MKMKGSTKRTHQKPTKKKKILYGLRKKERVRKEKEKKKKRKTSSLSSSH